MKGIYNMNDENNTNLSSGDNSEINPPETENTSDVFSESSEASQACGSENVKLPLSPEAADNCTSSEKNQINYNIEPLGVLAEISQAVPKDPIPHHDRFLHRLRRDLCIYHYNFI